MPCSVELPAGAGKTHIIASVGAVAAGESERALVLTHTNAGVDALRHRLKGLAVRAGTVRVETIASWSHELVRNYPEIAQLSAPVVPVWSDSERYYAGATLVASSQAVRRVLRASYRFAIVDEYQDCGAGQHALTIALSEVLPIAVFGDPLQSIFNFGGNVPVTWEQDVTPRWPRLDLPTRPWRWVGYNEALGRWLIGIRANISNGLPIALDRSAPVTWIKADAPNKTRACFSQPTGDGSVVAIGNLPHDCAYQARSLRGTYTVMEEIEGKEMMKFATIVDAGKPQDVAIATAEFGKTCAAKVAQTLNPPLIAKLRDARPVTNLRRPGAENALKGLSVLLTNPSAVRVREALVAIGEIPGVRLYRHDAWYTVLNALDLADASNITVATAVCQIRNRTRITGRRVAQRVISRPVLIKGLEYDHAVILDGDSHTSTSLYVALTRARRSLTVLSREPILGQHWRHSP